MRKHIKMSCRTLNYSAQTNISIAIMGRDHALRSIRKFKSTWYFVHNNIALQYAL